MHLLDIFLVFFIIFHSGSCSKHFGNRSEPVQDVCSQRYDRCFHPERGVQCCEGYERVEGLCGDNKQPFVGCAPITTQACRDLDGTCVSAKRCHSDYQLHGQGKLCMGRQVCCKKCEDNGGVCMELNKCDKKFRLEMPCPAKQVCCKVCEKDPTCVCRSPAEVAVEGCIEKPAICNKKKEKGCFKERECVEAAKVEKRIINGVDAKENEFPFMVRLEMYYRDDRPSGCLGHCGGSIISKRWILTAEHCFKDNATCGDRIKNITRPFNNFNVYLGDHNRSNHQMEKEQRFTGLKKNIVTKHQSADVALIKLPADGVILDKKTKYPICLPTGKNLKEEKIEDLTFTSIGWGETKPPKKSIILQEQQFKVVSNQECDKFYTKITDEMVCAVKSNTAICNGDSGGPMFGILPKEPKYYIQVGVVSFSKDDNKTGTCDLNIPDVYVRVQKIVDWIEDTIGPEDKLP